MFCGGQVIPMSFDSCEAAQQFIEEAIEARDPNYQVDRDDIEVQQDPFHPDNWFIRIGMETGRDLLLDPNGGVSVDITSGFGGVTSYGDRVSGTGITWRFNPGIVDELRKALTGCSD